VFSRFLDTLYKKVQHPGRSVPLPGIKRADAVRSNRGVGIVVSPMGGGLRRAQEFDLSQSLRGLPASTNQVRSDKPMTVGSIFYGVLGLAVIGFVSGVVFASVYNAMSGTSWFARLSGTTLR
jgi:hypothetical protein